jgi:hypothetical protein
LSVPTPTTPLYIYLLHITNPHSTVLSTYYLSQLSSRAVYILHLIILFDLRFCFSSPVSRRFARYHPHILIHTANPYLPTALDKPHPYLTRPTHTLPTIHTLPPHSPPHQTLSIPTSLVPLHTRITRQGTPSQLHQNPKPTLGLPEAVPRSKKFQYHADHPGNNSCSIPTLIRPHAFVCSVPPPFKYHGRDHDQS